MNPESMKLACCDYIFNTLVKSYVLEGYNSEGSGDVWMNMIIRSYTKDRTGRLKTRDI